MIAVLVAMLTFTASANAGTYVISNCPAAPGASADAGSWVLFGSPQPAKATCSGGSGDWIGPRGGSMTPGTLAGVKLTAPGGSGVTIHEAKVWWSVPHQVSGGDIFALAGTNGGAVGESTTPLEHKVSPDTFVLPSSTTSFTVEAYCANDAAGANCVEGGGTNPILQLYGAQMTLAESSPPKGTTTGGGLQSTSAIAGPQDLSFNAEDSGSGIRVVNLLVDGQPAASKDFLASCSYSSFAACPGGESGTIEWNTAHVADGTHSIVLDVQDAAQNTATLYTGTITTQNAPANSTPPTIVIPSTFAVGVPVTSQPGGWSTPEGAGVITYGYQWLTCDSTGSNCQPIPAAQSANYTPAPADIGRTLRVHVNAADNDGMSSATSAPSSIVPASSSSLGATPGPGASLSGSSSGGSSDSNLLGAGAGSGAALSQGAFLRLGVGGTIDRPYNKRAFTLTGQLTNAQGQPVAGGNLNILQRVVGTGAVKVIKHATTRADGTFSVAIPAGPSRLLEVGYRPSESTGYQASASVLENVAAGVRLAVTPRRTASHGTIHLVGKVSGPLPRRGAVVELLVHYHGRWVPFRTPRTNRRGHFNVAYQFQGGLGRFPFRAAIRAGQARFPYTGGYSNIVNVTTR